MNQFRAKRVDNNQWVFGDRVQGASGKIYIFDYDDINHTDLGIYEVIPETVGQFTGLTDKRDIKIFEGDWIFLRPGYTSYVSFESGSYVSIYSHPEDGETLIIEDLGLIKDGVLDVIVIGNIHESEVLND